MCSASGGGLLSTLIDFARQERLAPALRLVPQCSLVNLPQGIQISERNDGADYIIAIDAMLNPDIAETRSKHQAARDYQAGNPGTQIREVCVQDPATRSTLIATDSAWQTSRYGNGNGTRVWEQNAFLRCLEHHREFKLSALLAEDEHGTPLGFTLNENLGNGYYMAHFGKTLSGHTGLSEWLELETARRMQAQGCQWMNFQEDLGNPGLRRMKQSWNPCYLLRVYDVHAL